MQGGPKHRVLGLGSLSTPFCKYCKPRISIISYFRIHCCKTGIKIWANFGTFYFWDGLNVKVMPAEDNCCGLLRQYLNYNGCQAARGIIFNCWIMLKHF